jgi:hypothetical protein
LRVREKKVLIWWHFQVLLPNLCMHSQVQHRPLILPVDCQEGISPAHIPSCHIVCCGINIFLPISFEYDKEHQRLNSVNSFYCSFLITKSMFLSPKFFIYLLFHYKLNKLQHLGCYSTFFCFNACRENWLKWCAVFLSLHGLESLSIMGHAQAHDLIRLTLSILLTYILRDLIYVRTLDSGAHIVSSDILS